MTIYVLDNTTRRYSGSFDKILDIRVHLQDGYSYGRVLASHVEKRLKENKIQVDFLVTVDAAAGPQNDQVDRVVSENRENLNIYQKTPSSVGFRGEKIKDLMVLKRVLLTGLKYRMLMIRARKEIMNHAAIQSATEVIQAIREKLNSEDDKKK